VLAHPDDESMGAGGLILRHTRHNVPTYLVCATYGEAGWSGKPIGAKKEDLPEIRARELEEAASALALSGVELWDYPDGGVAQSDHTEITHRITKHIEELKPKAVVGWGPDGGYGHPDHIWMGACTDAAIAAMPEAERPALYHLAVDQQLIDFYKEAMRLGTNDGGFELKPPEKEADVVIDLDVDEMMMKMRAIDCHASQLEPWRIAIRQHPHLMQRGYGHEPYVSVSSKASGLSEHGLLGEFA